MNATQLANLNAALDAMNITQMEIARTQHNIIVLVLVLTALTGLALYVLSGRLR